MPMERLLVCIDGSKECEEAVRFAANMARMFDSTVSLMYVWSPPASEEQEMLIPTEAPDEEGRFQSAEGILNDAAVRYEVVRAVGNPSEQILDESRKGYDLAIMGTRGLGGMDRFLLGSVTSRVSHHIKIPLTVVPPRHAIVDKVRA